jgi:hypothetical protein
MIEQIAHAYGKVADPPTQVRFWALRDWPRAVANKLTQSEDDISWIGGEGRLDPAASRGRYRTTAPLLQNAWPLVPHEGRTDKHHPPQSGLPW